MTEPAVTLKEYFDRELALRDKLYEERTLRFERSISSVEETAIAAITASDKAIDKAERANEKRMDSTNEWRSTVTDIVSGCVTRKELLAWMFGMVGFVATLVTLTALFFKK